MRILFKSAAAFSRQGFASEQLPQRCLMFCFSCKIAIHQLLKWAWVKTVLATTTSPCIWTRAVFTLGWEIGQNAWSSNRSYHCQGYSLTAVCILGVMANILTCLVLARYRVSSPEDRPLEWPPPQKKKKKSCTKLDQMNIFLRTKSCLEAEEVGI